MKQSTRTRIKVNREDLAWAGGLFEGEGWISTQNNKPSIGIQMCDIEVLERFQKIVRCGHIHPRANTIQPTEKIVSRKPRWQWRATSFELVQFILVVLWPWLGTRRRKRAREVLLLAHSLKVSTRKAYKRVPTINRSIWSNKAGYDYAEGPHGDR